MDRSESCNKVIFVGTNGPFGNVDAMDIGWDELEGLIVGSHEGLECFGTFIIQNVEDGL